MSKLKNRLPLIVYLLLVLVILCFLALLIGPAKISASKVFNAIFVPSKSNISFIIWQVRMPRLILGLTAGAVLGIAGSILLGIFGNSIIDSWAVKGFYGAALLAAAASVLLMAFGVNLSFAYPWLLGSLTGASWGKVLIMLGFLIIGIIVYIFYYKDLNALLFGHYTAKTLGVEVNTVTIFLLISALVLAGGAAYFCGILCLAGLLVPYFVRLATGVNYKYLIPVSIMSAASLVVLLDIFARIVFPAELPVGILAALLGGPFYLYALQRRRLGL